MAVCVYKITEDTTSYRTHTEGVLMNGKVINLEEYKESDV